MNCEIASIVKKLAVTVYYDDSLEDKGKYLPILNIIVINNSLDDFYKKQALLHELGHAAEDMNNYELYKRTYALKSKMEFSANRFMINFMIDENEGNYNYSKLVEEFNLGMGYDSRYAK